MSKKKTTSLEQLKSIIFLAAPEKFNFFPLF